MLEGDNTRKLGKLFRSSMFRLALLYMALFAGSVAILLSFLYWSTVGYLVRQTDETIEAEITGLAEQYRRRGLQGLASVIAERIERGDDTAVYLFATHDYRPLAGNLDRWPVFVASDDGWLTFEQPRPDGQPLRARAKVFALRGGLHLLVGRDIGALAETEALFIRALVWGLGVTLALALLGGSLMSWSMLRRLDQINQTSRDIMTGDLGRRIPTRGTGDDFDRLADNLNAMLDQIEKLMRGVREVADNVAHDLRTPLTRLRGRLELLQREAGAGSENYALVEACLAEADRLLQTFNALLRIARIESGGHGGRFADVDLSALVHDAVELYAAVAEERSQQLRVDAPVGLRIGADRDLVFQALTNLLDNAVKFSPAGAQIDVRAWTADARVWVEVSDNGPGVPAGEREQVLRRFYRGEASRSTPGNGLGLSLVRAVTSLHGASLELIDNAPGLSVRLGFPSQRAASLNHSGADAA